MRKTFSLACLAAVGLCLGLGGQAAAQGYGRPQTSPWQRPTVSPYLNMTRGGNQAVNYFGLVRPQQDAARSIQQLQLQQVQQQQALLGAQTFVPVSGEDPQQAGLPTTGHPVTFFNYSRYFPLAGGGRPGAAPAAGAYRR
jgi:hypothetical protein